MLKLGPEYICEECTQYPRSYMAYGDVVEESLYTSCPVVISKLVEKESIKFILGEDRLPSSDWTYGELYRFEAGVRAEMIAVI